VREASRLARQRNGNGTTLKTRELLGPANLDPVAANPGPYRNAIGVTDRCESKLVTCGHSGFSAWIVATVLATALASAPATADNTIASNQAGAAAAIDPHVRSLGEYVHSGVIEVSPLGLKLREDKRQLKSGASAKGLLIVGLAKGGPAANAGLRAIQETAQQVLEGVAIAGSMAFPPAIILLPVFASLPLGSGGDLIIAVDGFRVTNAIDFEDNLRDVQPGEIVYLTIIRGGERQQTRLVIPPIAHLENDSPSK
jgi:S1-C subfamily serine protease